MLHKVCISDDGNPAAATSHPWVCSPPTAWIPGRAIKRTLMARAHQDVETATGWMYKGCRIGKPWRRNGKLFTVRIAVMDKMRSSLGFHSQLRSLQTSGLSTDTEAQLLLHILLYSRRPIPGFHCQYALTCIFHYLKVAFKEVICGYDGCLSKDLLLYSSCRQTPCWSHLHLSWETLLSPASPAHFNSWYSQGFSKDLVSQASVGDFSEVLHPVLGFAPGSLT